MEAEVTSGGRLFQRQLFDCSIETKSLRPLLLQYYQRFFLTGQLFRNDHGRIRDYFYTQNALCYTSVHPILYRFEVIADYCSNSERKTVTLRY